MLRRRRGIESDDLQVIIGASAIETDAVQHVAGADLGFCLAGSCCASVSIWR